MAGAHRPTSGRPDGGPDRAEDHGIDAAAAEDWAGPLLDQLPTAVVVDADGRYLYANPAAHQLLGTRDLAHLGEWLGGRHHVGDEDRRRLENRLRELDEGASGTVATEWTILRPDGGERRVRWQTFATTFDGLDARLYTIVDLTAEHRATRQLAAARDALGQSLARLRELEERSPDLIFHVQLDPLAVEYVSPAAVRATGRDVEDLRRSPERLVDLVHPDDRRSVVDALAPPELPPQLEFRILDARGDVRVVDARIGPLASETGRPGAIIAARDVTDGARLRDRLERLAHLDPLTDLLNRRALLDELTARAEERRPTTLLFVDLDGFKAVNDTHGHEMGDQVLSEVAHRLRSTVRSDDVVARLAGDEFVIAVAPEVAEPLAARLLETLREPLVLTDRAEVGISASIGVAHLDPDLDDPVTDALRRADEAMYRAKRAGRDGIATRGGPRPAT